MFCCQISLIDLFTLCTEQQAAADALASDNVHRRPPLAGLLGAPLVVLRDGQSAIWPAQLRHSMLFRKFHPQTDRSRHVSYGEAGGP